MIKSTIKIHDKFSVVIDVTYNTIFKRKESVYTTITYLFFPDSLNINNKTYPSTKFYNDVRLFTKYDSPKYTLSQINRGKNSLLKRLETNTNVFINDSSEKKRSLYEDQVKMFASIFTSLISERVDAFFKSKSLNVRKVESFLNMIPKMLSKYRKIVESVSNSSLIMNNKKFVLYADEHMSNVVELQLMRLYNYLKRHELNNQLNTIIKIIDYEQKYKRDKGYDSPKSKSISSEELLYKRNQLKKYIDSVVFLNQDVRKDGVVFEQTLLAMAAGLAMIFSTGVAFYFQKYYGNFTLPFFIALIISYMLKDRIKSFISMQFMSKSSTFFYDFRINITNSLGRRIGFFKESFGFVPFKKLESVIKKYRFKDRTINTRALNEQIIQYKKKIILNSKRFSVDLPDENILGLIDITRFNFHRFIQYMDDPEKDYILVKKGELYTKIADKVYPINIIQKYFTEKGAEYRRYRIIMSRNGIKRIEKVRLNDVNYKN
ncbi:hypothetical protein FF125_17440 [Aureibaculum algae]|uniref:Uncharacterized protein n=1 Tax=Aureibaculum algae TaxID=2584122 RepID=A0A5B7TZN2_9FLAO|nr:hypothetical protein [Aureibaculum algae]QCX40142.1 hypothetical protein FF125_17440 [Aureibaculum algae]